MSWALQKEIARSSQENMARALTTIVDTAHQAVRTWVDKEKASAQIWAHSGEVRQYVGELLNLPRNRDALSLAPGQAALRTVLDSVVAAQGHEGFLVVTPKGVIVASSYDEVLGTSMQLIGATAEFDKICADTSIVGFLMPDRRWFGPADPDAVPGRARIVACAAVHDDHGAVMAGLLFGMDPARDFMPILQRGRMGRSGETYAFDARGLMISHSRYADELERIGLIPENARSAFRVELRDPGRDLRKLGDGEAVIGEQPLTRMAQAAVHGESGVDVIGYRDYRGVRVIGAWIWDATLNMGFATEVDSAEAFRALATSETVITIGTLILAVLMVIFIVLVGRSRRRLLASESQLRGIMENVSVGVITIDEGGRIESFNPMAEGMFGYSEREVLGKNVAMLMPEPYASEHDGYLERYKSTGESRILGVGPRELVGRRKDGAEFPLELTVGSTWVGEKRVFIGGLLDSTTRKQAEAQLREAQRLETVGKLTGGVAHDFNNLLLALQLNIEALEPKMVDDPEGQMFVGDALSTVRRAAELTKRLLAFSRRQVLEPETVDVNRRLLDLTRLLQRTLGETIEIETVLSGGLWKASVDAAQFDNAVLNMAINARDAMPDGGKLTIETANARLDEDYARRHEEVTPGRYVMVAISDTGTGMSDEVVRQAFEPFFTTKEVGKGSGLGLSMVYGFVKQSGGHIKIYSELGHGTTIRTYFPKAASDEEAPDEPEPALPTQKGKEHILLVEDDEFVRIPLARSLKNLGYTVTEAPDGPTALRLIETRASPPDLVLSDLVLPGGMGGRDVVEAVLARVPGCKALFMSGYAENAIVHHGRVDEGYHLLHKPYTQDQLARKVRDVLDS